VRIQLFTPKIEYVSQAVPGVFELGGSGLPLFSGPKQKLDNKSMDQIASYARSHTILNNL
jgi:hypothetical protein